MLLANDLPEAPFVDCGGMVASIVQREDAKKELGQRLMRGVFREAVFQSIAHVEGSTLYHMYGSSEHGEPLVLGCRPHSAATASLGSGTRNCVAHVNTKSLLRKNPSV
jgi:hypothetical protein